MTTVVVVDEAEQHLRDIIAWWKENRLAAPDLVLREFRLATVSIVPVMFVHAATALAPKVEALLAKTS